MKKFIIAFIAILYMGISAGFAMEVHYCMGKKAGFDFYGSVADKCGKCGMKNKKSGCCNDDYKFFKLNDSHKNVTITENIPSLSFALVPVVFSFFNDRAFNANDRTSFTDHSPPYPTVDANILHCVFRI